MDRRFRDVAQQAARSRVNHEVEDRVVSPLANKVGGCATVLFIVLFTALGVGAALTFGRLGGDPDAIGPVAVGIGIVGGIVLGALTGNAVGRVLRRLLTR
jgi:hypothetical protein